MTSRESYHFKGQENHIFNVKNSPELSKSFPFKSISVSFAYFVVQ